MMNNNLSVFIFLITAVLFSCNKTEELPDINSSFTTDMDKIFVGQSVIFTDSSSGNPDNWTWHFDGGTPAISNEQSPTITYNTEGIFDVSLSSSNQQKSGTIEKQSIISVYTPLEAEFDVTDSIINEETEIIFNNSSLGTSPIWEWEFEGGTPSTSSVESPSVVYSTPGIYNATLKISNDFETSGETKTIEIVVLPTSGLVAYYPFNGNTSDESGNNLDGVNYEAVLTSDKNGNPNQAYHFDGIDDRIEISNNSLFESQSYTISAWIKAEKKTGAIISLSSFNPTQNNCGYYLSILNNNIRGFSNISTSNWAKNVDTNIVSLDEWHHIVFSYDGQTLYIYLDGVIASSKSQSHVVDYSEHNPLQIGTYSNQSGATSFQGDIDGVRVFNRALNNTEINALYKE